MFMLISLVNKKSDFQEDKHFSNKNNLRNGYGRVFHLAVFLGRIFPRGIHHGGI